MARKIEVQNVGDSSSLVRALSRAQSSGSLFGKVGKLAASGVAAIGAAGVLAGGAAVKMALDFDSSMSKIRALVGASDKQMDEYKTGVLAGEKYARRGCRARLETFRSGHQDPVLPEVCGQCGDKPRWCIHRWIGIQVGLYSCRSLHSGRPSRSEVG